MSNDGELREFEWACVDQEVITLHGPADMEKATPQYMDLSLEYIHRSASPAAAARALGEPVPRTPSAELSTETRHAHKRANAPPRLLIRTATESELRPARDFSRQTLPLIYATFWPSNLCEWVVKTVYSFYALRHVLPTSLAIVLHGQFKDPLPEFAFQTLQPFTSLAVADFAQFSDRSPPDTRSNSTHEGRHVRCFRRLLVWANKNAALYHHRGAAFTLGQHIRSHAAPQIAELVRQGPAFWSATSSASVTRVLIETRPVLAGSRQFVGGLGSLMGSCAASSSYECKTITFGEHSLAHTMWVLSSVDVLVSYHGAGQMNVIFARPHTSLVEVRALSRCAAIIAPRPPPPHAPRRRGLAK